MEVNERKKKSVDFALKAAWLSVAKMYNVIGEKYDVTHSIGFVLLNIDAENGTPATKIAPLMGMEARSLTRILKSLEERNLIERKEDAEDKRKVIICLTEEGRKKREFSRVAVKEFNRRVTEAFTPEQLSAFFEVANGITEVIAQTIADENHDNVVKEILTSLGTTKK